MMGSLEGPPQMASVHYEGEETMSAPEQDTRSDGGQVTQTSMNRDPHSEHEEEMASAHGDTASDSDDSGSRREYAAPGGSDPGDSSDDSDSDTESDAKSVE